MNWIKKLFVNQDDKSEQGGSVTAAATQSKSLAAKPVLSPTGKTTAAHDATPFPKTSKPSIAETSGPEFQQVSDALSKFLDESEDAARLQQVKALQAMGEKSLAPLLREAFAENGDPTTENINIYKIRLAVWCGCALHPQEFQNYYQTRYTKGRSPRLDEMRGINMKDGMSRCTYVHRLLASENSANTSCPAPVPHTRATTQSVDDLLRAGMKFYLGTEVPCDYAEAKKHFNAAADMGSAMAQDMMGVIFDNGFGVAQDFQEALRWFRLSAKQGYAPAEFCIGVMYRDGRGVPKDYTEASAWIRRAAEKGNAEAQFNLGLMHFYGHGVAKDMDEATKWWGRASEQGNVNAKKNLAILSRSSSAKPG